MACRRYSARGTLNVTSGAGSDAEVSEGRGGEPGPGERGGAHRLLRPLPRSGRVLGGRARRRGPAATERGSAATGARSDRAGTPVGDGVSGGGRGMGRAPMHTEPARATG